MIRAGGKPRNLFRAVHCCIGFAVLLVASLLAASNPATRIFPPSFFESAVPSPVAMDPTPEVVAGQPALRMPRRHPVRRAVVDLEGWRLYLHSAAPAVSTCGLRPVCKARSVAALGRPTLRPVVPTAVALPRLISYRTHAPPA